MSSGERFFKTSGHLDRLNQQVIQFNELFNPPQAQVGLGLRRPGPNRRARPPGWGRADI